MAIFYVTKAGNDSNDGLSSGNPKLTISATITAAESNSTGTPHTINIGAGTYEEAVVADGDSNMEDATVQGDTGDYSDVIIQGSSAYQVRLGTGVTFKNITVINNASAAGAAKYAVLSGAGASTVYNCHLKSNNRGYYSTAAGSIIERCIVQCTYEGVSQGTWGVWWSAANPSKIYSCLVIDWNHAQIYCYDKGDAVNVTVQTQYVKNTSLRGVYADNIWNCVAHKDSAVDSHSGIEGGTIHQNSVVWNFADDVSSAGGTEANNHESSAVSSNGEEFIDEDNNNFRIRATSLAKAAGAYTYQTNNSTPLYDLVGRAYDTSAPSAGCYQYAWGAAGGKKLAGVDRDVINKIAGVASTTIAKRNGQG